MVSHRGYSNDLSNRGRDRDVCQLYLRGRCTRGDACRYAHPKSQETPLSPLLPDPNDDGCIVYFSGFPPGTTRDNIKHFFELYVLTPFTISYQSCLYIYPCHMNGMLVTIGRCRLGHH
jgi:hypothetical protein